MYEQYDGKNRCCGTCAFYCRKLLSYECENKESENYTYEVESKDKCDDWEER